LQLDVFSLLPHAFAWLTEQRPVAAVLGEELELRLLNYRDYTPLGHGQVDDEPYGGGAGMVLRVDVVAAALDAASDAISIGPYVLSGGELPAMVVLDAIARRLPGALGSEESGLVESFSAELDGGLEYPHYTRPSEFRGWRVPDVLLSGDHRRIDEWRMEQSRLRSAP
jgi:tRNA (guanine37-N1)-methyltransferase